ncbi:MAG: ArsA family ATPase [Oscillatoriales cyanobacterium SM2_2_1]|nr:ArsA family ATPase [Oscillatoriales cyanobacterium SM2_2_1]
MTQLITLLGKGGVGKTTAVIALARTAARTGKRTLLVGHLNGTRWAERLGCPLPDTPQEIAPQLWGVQLSAASLLADYWEKMKGLEAQYLRMPVLQEVFGAELGILPGMDGALTLSYLRERYDEGQYDLIIYDGTGDGQTLRMWGMPEILNWYLRRFRQILTGSALGQALSPFLEPMLRSVLQVSMPTDLGRSGNKMTSLLDRGQSAVGDRTQVLAYLVTSDDPEAIAVAQFLWSSAQQVGLTVGGVYSHGQVPADAFAPLAIAPFGSDPSANLPLIPANSAPAAITLDIPACQARLYLPHFDKRQVKLTQMGPEITIEAGDQRRNLFLPPELNGKQAIGAKFQDGYLIITFG